MSEQVLRNFVEESKCWGSWEIRIKDDPDGFEHLREIEIVHSHDGNDYPIIDLSCAGEDFGPSCAEWICALNNEAPDVIAKLQNRVAALERALDQARLEANSLRIAVHNSGLGTMSR
jgi:hypothetical protein